MLLHPTLLAGHAQSQQPAEWQQCHSDFSDWASETDTGSRLGTAFGGASDILVLPSNDGATAGALTVVTAAAEEQSARTALKEVLSLLLGQSTAALDHYMLTPAAVAAVAKSEASKAAQCAREEAVQQLTASTKAQVDAVQAEAEERTTKAAAEASRKVGGQVGQRRHNTDAAARCSLSSCTSFQQGHARTLVLQNAAPTFWRAGAP